MWITCSKGTNERKSGCSWRLFAELVRIRAGGNAARANIRSHITDQHTKNTTTAATEDTHGNSQGGYHQCGLELPLLELQQLRPLMTSYSGYGRPDTSADGFCVALPSPNHERLIQGQILVCLMGHMPHCQLQGRLERWVCGISWLGRVRICRKAILIPGGDPLPKERIKVLYNILESSKKESGNNVY